MPVESVWREASSLWARFWSSFIGFVVVGSGQMFRILHRGINRDFHGHQIILTRSRKLPEEDQVDKLSGLSNPDQLAQAGISQFHFGDRLRQDATLGNNYFAFRDCNTRQRHALQGVMGVKKIVRKLDAKTASLPAPVDNNPAQITQATEAKEVGKVKSKGGRPRTLVSEEAKKKVLQGVRLGIPVDRLIPIAIPSGSPGAWMNLLRLDPEFAAQLSAAKAEGELDLVLRVSSSGDGWQSSAWLLERTRGYVARQSLEHSGPGGKSLTIAHQVLAVVNPLERG